MSLTQLLNHSAAHLSCQQHLLSLMTTLIQKEIFPVALSLQITVIVNIPLGSVLNDSSSLSVLLPVHVFFFFFDTMTHRLLASSLVFHKRAHQGHSVATKRPCEHHKIINGTPYSLVFKGQDKATAPFGIVI